jgi:predicted dehydrogenase
MMHASDSKKVSWGLIGCGDIARKRVAPALRDLQNCELLAVSRANFALAESFAQEFGARRSYEDWQQLITDSEIEAVYIATPVYLHARQAIAAAEAGNHILCEKPMALSVEECDRMIDACESNKVNLGVAYYRHFYPVIARVKEILKSGEVGKPVIAQVNAFENFDPGPSHPRRWLIERKRSGGGPMFDFGCHRLEVLLNLFGPINEIKSLMGNVLFSHEVEDTAIAMFKFETGLQAVLSVSHAISVPEDTLTIYGSGGSIQIPLLNEGRIIVRTQHGERVETHSPHSNLHEPLIDDFARAVLDDREPQVDGHQGRAVARIEADIYDPY